MSEESSFQYYRPLEQSFDPNPPKPVTESGSPLLALNVPKPSVVANTQSVSQSSASSKRVSGPHSEPKLRRQSSNAFMLPSHSDRLISEEQGEAGEMSGATSQYDLDFLKARREPNETRPRRAGRNGNYGIKLSIPNSIREKALAETKRKRRRCEGDEHLGDSEENTAMSPRNTKGEYSCDQCFNRRTKVASSFGS